MTEHGLHHNACFDQSRLKISDVKRWLPSCARSLAYYRDDQSGWRAALTTMRELAELGVKNSVIANTETLGGGLLSHDLNKQRLIQFLNLAAQEYSYYDNETQTNRPPVHELEPLNEIDTPGWDDGEGGPITASKVVDYCYNLYDIAASYGVSVIGPSFLGGPLSGLPVEVISTLARDRKIKVAAFHTYGRSINSKPKPSWIWGTTENAIDDILTYCGDMSIDLTEQGCWTVDGNLGEDAQADYVKAFCAFNHPRVRRMHLFTNNDWVPYDGEYYAGKDFGLVTRDGVDKKSALVFKGELGIVKPQPSPVDGYQFVLGFRDFNTILKNGGIDPGKPLQNEWGPWPLVQVQATENGEFLWADTPLGGRLTYLHRGGSAKPRMFRWQGDWSTYQEMFEGSLRV